MSIKELLELLGQILLQYFTNPLFKEYSGKFIITINCKKGNVCNFNVDTSTNYNKDDLSENKG